MVSVRPYGGSKILQLQPPNHLPSTPSDSHHKATSSSLILVSLGLIVIFSRFFAHNKQNMQSKSYPTLALTSTVIPSNPEGKYPYSTLGFLIPHEMLRREFARARKAIDGLDTVAAPMKADALMEWLDEFLIPLLHAHHHVEDNIIFPFYFALGIVAPERQAEDHVSLIGRMNKLQSLTRQLVHYGHKSGKSNKVEVIRSYEDRVKKEFLDMINHFERHFAEEEEFWPELLKKYGEGNWKRVERMIVQYTLSFGDHNAGDPYRMLICAVCRAMGIVIGKDTLDPDEVPWAGVEFQDYYISSRPLPLRLLKVPQWNTRYTQFRRLIESVANTTNHVVLQKKNGLFVQKTKKSFVPMILFLFLSAIFCLATMPIFAAVANPLRNVKFLHIKFVNYDTTGLIGTKFTEFLGHVSAGSDEIPTFHYESPDTDYLTYEQRVLEGEAWAVISVNAGASASLAAAVAGGCVNASNYDPSSVLSFSWDEGRNNIVSSPYIGGFSRGIIGKFGTQFASTYLSSLSSTDVQQCIANGESSLLTDPISFTEFNLTPVSRSFVVTNIGITIGNILMAVFGSMFVVNATYNGTAALAEDYSPVGKISLKAFTMALIGFGCAISYATAMVGFTRYGSSHYTYEGYEWAQVFAVQWMHIMIWSFGMGTVTEALGPSMVPFFFVVCLIYSVTGGWNIDLADQGYKHFFQIFPFHWVLYILRYTFYKSQGFHRRISAGILVSYWIVVVFCYFYFGIRNERLKHLFQKVIVVEEVDKSGPGQVFTGNDDANEEIDLGGGESPPPSPHKSLTSSGHVVYHVVKEKEEDDSERDSTHYTGEKV